LQYFGQFSLGGATKRILLHRTSSSSTIHRCQFAGIGTVSAMPLSPNTPHQAGGWVAIADALPRSRVALSIE